MKESLIHNDLAVVSDHQSAEVPKPGKRPFDFPTSFVPSQFSSILHLGAPSPFPVGADQLYPSSFQTLTQFSAIVCTVCDHSFGPILGPARAFSRNSNRLKRRLSKLYLRRRSGIESISQRNTLAIDHHHPLRTFAAFRFPDTGAPFFAEAKLPSKKDSLQSSLAFASSSARKARHTFNHTPCSSHRRNRLQQVLGLGYSAGRSRHLAPVFSTQRMPSNTSRLCRQGLPALLNFGKSGEIFSHCASVSIRLLPIGSPPTGYNRQIRSLRPYETTCSQICFLSSLQGLTTNTLRAERNSTALGGFGRLWRQSAFPGLRPLPPLWAYHWHFKLKVALH